MNAISESYYSEIMRLNPLRYYRLGELSGTTAYDSSAQAQNGTINGGVTLGQPGLIKDANGAMLFNGSTGYISGPGTSLPTGANTWSMAIWFQIASQLNSYQIPIGFGTSSTASASNVALYFNADGTFHVGFYGAGDVAGTVPSLNVPHCACATYDGATLRLYQQGMQTGASAAAGALGSGNVVLAIAPTFGYGLFAGVLDEAIINGYALSSDQIARLYHVGSNAGILRHSRSFGRMV